jgi:hypothetical protein
MTPIRPTLTKQLTKQSVEQPTVDVAKLLMLLEQWTRADVMSRLGSLLSDTDYARTKIDKEDEIRKLLYGTCSLSELAAKWGMR